MACTEGDDGKVDELLQAGADPNVKVRGVVMVVLVSGSVVARVDVGGSHTQQLHQGVAVVDLKEGRAGQGNPREWGLVGLAGPGWWAHRARDWMCGRTEAWQGLSGAARTVPAALQPRKLTLCAGGCRSVPGSGATGPTAPLPRPPHHHPATHQPATPPPGGMQDMDGKTPMDLAKKDEVKALLRAANITA